MEKRWHSIEKLIEEVKVEFDQQDLTIYGLDKKMKDCMIDRNGLAHEDFKKATNERLKDLCSNWDHGQDLRLIWELNKRVTKLRPQDNGNIFWYKT